MTKLMDQGASDYVIIVPKDAALPVRFAAGELSRYLAQMTGVTLPVMADCLSEGSHELCVGPVERAEAPDTAALIHDGYRIVTCGDRLFVAGGSERGVVYGVYALLEEKKSAFDPRVFFPPIMDTVLTGTIPDDDVALLMSRVEAGVKEAVGSLIVNFGSYGKAPLVEQKSLEDMTAFYKK